MAFVKFSRGLSETYRNLSRKDPDTLYLVYDSIDAETGNLYLGDKLISSCNANSISLNDLTDVVISGQLEDGMLLQYNNSTAGQNPYWQAVSLSEVINNLPSGTNNVSIVESLENIDDPQENDIVVVGQDVYIYDGNDWVQLTDSNLESRISSLETQVGHPADDAQGIAATGLYKEIADLQDELSQQIGNIDHLQYQVVESINEIDLNDAENTIFLVPKDIEDVEASDGYDEYFVINGNLEKIGTWGVNSNQLLTEEQKNKLDSLGWDSVNEQVTIQAAQVGGLNEAIAANSYITSVAPGSFEVVNHELRLIATPGVDLSNYVTTTMFNNAVGDLTQLTQNNLVDEINMIKTSVIWQEISQQQNGD